VGFAFVSSAVGMSDKRQLLTHTRAFHSVHSQAVAKETFYLFGDNDWSDWVNFTEHYARPPWNYANREPFYSFGIGGSGSGVPFHTHGAVFAEVLWGRKRWFFSR
jgi:hypothetical protein